MGDTSIRDTSIKRQPDTPPSLGAPPRVGTGFAEKAAGTVVSGLNKGDAHSSIDSTRHKADPAQVGFPDTEPKVINGTAGPVKPLPKGEAAGSGGAKAGRTLGTEASARRSSHLDGGIEENPAKIKQQAEAAGRKAAAQGTTGAKKVQ